jgi:hypothetical protein
MPHWFHSRKLTFCSVARITLRKEGTCSKSRMLIMLILASTIRWHGIGLNWLARSNLHASLGSTRGMMGKGKRREWMTAGSHDGFIWRLIEFVFVDGRSKIVTGIGCNFLYLCNGVGGILKCVMWNERVEFESRRPQPSQDRPNPPSRTNQIRRFFWHSACH